MSYVKHSITCIAVGGYDKEKLHEVDGFVALLPPPIAARLIKSHSVVNDVWFYALLPDGSNEGWRESDDFDEMRRRLVMLQPRNAVDVFWGGDDPKDRGFNNDVPPPNPED